MKIKPKLFKRNKAAISRNRPIQEGGRLPSTSNFSYRSSRIEEKLNTGRNEEKEKPKTEKQLLLKVEIILFFLIVLVFAYKVLYVSSIAEVKPIVNSEVIASSDILKYQSTANKELSSSLLNKNKLTLNSAAIESKILSLYPQVQSVSVKLGFFSSRPVIYIDQTQGVLIIKNLNNEYYSVNLLGRAIKASYNLKDLKLPSSIPVINDQSGYKVALNKQVLPSSDVAFALVIKQELSAKNIAISSYTLPASTSELDIGIVGAPYIVKFNLANTDDRQQAGTYLATIAQLKAQNITPAKYIDVRVDDRAYYQ